MATYTWDFGIDCNAAPDSSLSNSCCYLQNGFVNAAARSQAIPVNLQTGDVIQFWLYDVTPNVSSSQASNCQITTGSVINFTSAESSQTQATPFSGSSFDIKNGSSSMGGRSSIFQVWGPFWGNIIDPQTISVSSGRYLMSVILNVTITTTNSATGKSTTTSKTYSVDPEMIVGGFG
jgi:hypothetical protein